MMSTASRSPSRMLFRAASKSLDSWISMEPTAPGPSLSPAISAPDVSLFA